MPCILIYQRETLDPQCSSPSAAMGAPNNGSSTDPVPMSSNLDPTTQGGGEEEDMDMDDDASMISRAPP